MVVFLSPGATMVFGAFVIIVIFASVIMNARSAGKVWRLVPLFLSPFAGITAGLLWTADPVEVGHANAEWYRFLAIVLAVVLVIQVVVGALLMSGVTRKTP